VATSAVLSRPLVLVGPGRAGRALGRSWTRAGGRLALIVARTPSAAARAGRELGGRGATAAGLPKRCEILVLAVPDDRIADVARDLARRTTCRFAFHLSGALPASVLAPFRHRGASVASLHPLRAFSADSSAAAADARGGARWKGALVAIEGDPEAVAFGERLAAALGAVGRRIDTASKPLYHAAATLAAGGTMALLSVAVRAAVRAGLSEADARAALGRLASEAAAATVMRPFVDAYTGPIARRDAQTVRAHRAAAGGARDFLELYRILAREILATTPARGGERRVRAILGGAGGGKRRTRRIRRREIRRG
jgi:predicted short-subunit dehydrogenase-like oxidoreductase (DUF2520 family)